MTLLTAYCVGHVQSIDQSNCIAPPQSTGHSLQARSGSDVRSAAVDVLQVAACTAARLTAAPRADGECLLRIRCRPSLLVIVTSPLSPGRSLIDTAGLQCCSAAEYTKACAALQQPAEVTQCCLGREGTSHCTHCSTAACCRPGRAPARTHPHSFLSGKKTDKAAARAALQLIVGPGDRYWANICS